MSEVVYEKTPLGQAIYNVYKRHGSGKDFFKKSKFTDAIVAEIEAEWKRLEKKEAAA